MQSHNSSGAEETGCCMKIDLNYSQWPLSSHSCLVVNLSSRLVSTPVALLLSSSIPASVGKGAHQRLLSVLKDTAS